MAIKAFSPKKPVYTDDDYLIVNFSGFVDRDEIEESGEKFNEKDYTFKVLKAKKWPLKIGRLLNNQQTSIEGLYEVFPKEAHQYIDLLDGDGTNEIIEYLSEGKSGESSASGKE